MTDTHEHEGHDKTCQVHDDHWQDDYAYVGSEKRLEALKEGPGELPSTESMAELISQLEDVIVFRFALVYVNGETGNIQVATNPGMETPGAINLLAKAISVMAFQEAQLEGEAKHIVNMGMKEALKNALQGGGEMPDLSRLLGGLPNPLMPVEDDTEGDERDRGLHDMRDGYL